MQRATVDGGHVEFVLHGSGDPMLFIHGAGIADAFLPLMNQPPLAGIQQIHYRRRGYGQSTPVGGPPESFMARAAADAAQLLANQSGIPQRKLALVNGSSTYAHVDPLSAYPQNDFVDGLLPFLKQTKKVKNAK